MACQSLHRSRETISRLLTLINPRQIFQDVGLTSLSEIPCLYIHGKKGLIQSQ